LTIYHAHSSSVIDKAEAIEVLVKKDGISKLRYEYNDWLYNFVNYQLKSVITEEEHESLKKMLGFCYHIFGLKSHLGGNSINALNNYKKAIEIREKINDKRGLLITNYNVALIFHENGNLSSALKLYEKCIKLGRENLDSSTLAKIYNNLYNIFRSKGNYLKSLNYLFKALIMYKEINDESGLATMYHNIGYLLESQHEIDEALKYYLAALKLSESIGDDHKQIDNCIGIGVIYQEKGKNNTALKYYLKAVNLQTNHYPNYAYVQIGTLYEVQNKIDIAMDYYRKSLQLCERIEHKGLLSETLNKIGTLEIKRGNVEKATSQIERAFELAQELTYPEQIKEAAASKVLLAIAIKDYKLAYKMEKLKNEMNEKILNKENVKVVIKHQLKYEYEKQLKQKDIEIEEEKRNSQQLQEQIDLLSAKNKQLTLKNKFINEQLAVKDELTQKPHKKNNGVYNAA